MDFTQEHKDKIERKILEILANALDAGQIENDDAPNVARFVLDRIDKVTNQKDLVAFLGDLSEKWPVFSTLKDQVEGETQDSVDDEVADGVEILIQHGKLEKALALVKSITKRK